MNVCPQHGPYAGCRCPNCPPFEAASTPLEWNALWQGGVRQTAVMITPTQIVPQLRFGRRVGIDPDGTERYRVAVAANEIVLFLDERGQGTGRTRQIETLAGCPHRRWPNWSEAERDLGLRGGVLKNAFWGIISLRRPPVQT